MDPGPEMEIQTSVSEYVMKNPIAERQGYIIFIVSASHEH